MASHAATTSAGLATEGQQTGCDTYRNRHLVDLLLPKRQIAGHPSSIRLINKFESRQVQPKASDIRPCRPRAPKNACSESARAARCS